MSLPEILPTGSLSSDEYVVYMISYLEEAIVSLDEQVNDCVAKHTVAGWDARWNQIIVDINRDITNITNDINKIKAQVTMLNNSI